MRRALRSYLFIPGDNEELLRKVSSTGADAVVLDLEDAVRPERKADARRLVAALVAQDAFGGIPVYVRINAVPEGSLVDDLKASVRGVLHGIRLAKAESAAQVQAVQEALEVLEQNAGMKRGSVKIVPTIESAAGVAAVEELAKAPRVEALCFGMADFLADIHARSDPEFTASLYALSRLVLASRAAGIEPPIGSVHTNLDDAEELRTTTEHYRTLGFFGRSVIHPKQLDVVHAVFTPSEQELAKAREIVDAYKSQEPNGRGTAIVGNMFVDEAVVKHARRLLELSARLGAEKGGL